MKSSGKDEEKAMGPMFPRLHVNDTEKGGPRAPPRNKMALYEQFSIPSQRFNSGASGGTPARHNSALVSSTSSSQDVGQERAIFSPFYVPAVPGGRSSERFQSYSSGKGNSPKMDSQTKTVGNINDKQSSITEKTSPITARNASHPDDVSTSKSFRGDINTDGDDFEVPTFVESRVLNRRPEIERATHFGTVVPDQSLITKKGNAAALGNSRQLQHDSNHEHMQASNIVDLVKKHKPKRVEPDIAVAKTVKEKSNIPQSSVEKIEEYLTCAKLSSYNENLNDSRNELENFVRNKSWSLHQAGKVDKDCIPTSLSIDGYESPNIGERCYEATGNGIRMFQQTGEGEMYEDSETSMVDSMSGLDVSPDDVVGMIGQKHFWKARKAIVNQQRVFAVQVFELHRLIKVQRLIAGAPHLLYDGQAHIGRPPKSSSTTPLPSERLIKAQPTAVKHKDDNPKPSQATSRPNSNAAEKTYGGLDNGVASTGVASQSSDLGLHSLNPQPPVVTDNKVGSWCFPPGNQWLVPVMSPSEGLVYKPYAGPYPPSGAFMAPIYGGCGPVGLPPVSGDFMGTQYRSPVPHQQSGLGLFPPMPSYFPPPYGYPVMNPMIPASTVEQAPRAAHGQGEQQYSAEVEYNMHSKNSCNVSNQKNQAKFPTSKYSEVQFSTASTASSPSNRGHKNAGGALQESSALSLFPMAPTSETLEGNISLKSNDHRTHVIKVVPHNRRSASESAARIFQSIQAGRGYDPDSH